MIETSKFSFFRKKPKEVKLDVNGNGCVHPEISETSEVLEDPMASVSIRVRNEDGDDFVVSPSDVVDNINEINSRRSSRRDSTPSSSIRRSRPSSAYFTENGEPIEGITRPARKIKSMDHIMMRLFKPSKARKSKSVRDAEPGLRSMLYGLSQRQEKEEAEAKKLAKKMIKEEESDDEGAGGAGEGKAAEAIAMSAYSYFTSEFVVEVARQEHQRANRFKDNTTACGHYRIR
ncbi:unnamed protein product [Caenorhabditis sp. 36 PRJEB53466]|nr:unnamed protein product [Caenorhabditis sp. 36 PRJEB53466]